MHLLGKWRSQPNDTATLDDRNATLSIGGLRLYLGKPIERHENDQAYLIFEGTIFDRRPHELLTSQTALDTAFGLYTYIRIDKHSHEVVLGADRQGYSPLYYAEENGEFIFSSSLTLVKYELSRVTPNYETWDEILNLEDILGDKTSITEISRLAPGTRIRLHNGKITFDRYWEPEIAPMGTRQEYAEKNNELLMEALELTRSAPGEKIMLMSGGQDSRRLGVTADHIDLPITIASQETVNYAGIDADVVIARRVAEYLKRPFLSVPLLPTEGFYNDSILRDYWLGFESNQHEWILPLVRELPKNSLLYDGITGDVTIQCGWFLEVFPELVDKWRDKDIDEAAERICRNRNIFPIDKGKLGSSLFERVRESIRQYPETPHRLNYYWMLNRSRRNTALQAQLYSLHGHRICFPFLYYPLFMQCMALHPGTLLEKRYQSMCMVLMNPGAVELPTTRGKLGPGDVIDRSVQRRERDLLFAKRSYLRSDVLATMPAVGSRLRAFKIGRALGIERIARRLKWIAWPVSRMSMFMDYLEDTQTPALPVVETEPAFVRDRLIHYD